MHSRMTAFERKMRLPLPGKVPLLRSYPVGGAEEAVAPEVPVPFLHEAEPGLVPHKPVVHEFLQRGIDVALAGSIWLGSSLRN
jgi:hypothetical protein